MEFKPLITIIIPVYNGERYIAEAIDSAISQDYDNKEILVIDDGSTDGTREIVKRYKDVVYHYKKNGGVASALNYGIEKAKGEYISWLSHDDYYHKNKLSVQVDILNKISEELRANSVLYSSYEEMNEDLVIYGKFEPQKRFSKDKLTDDYFPSIFGLVNGCTTLIPVKLIKEVGLFNEELRYTQDIDMWFRLFPKANVVFHDDLTLVSRKHRLQGTYNNDPKKVKEQNDLYKNMVNKVSLEQMVKMCGSEEKFLKKVLDFVYELNYMEAAEYIEERLGKLNKGESIIKRILGKLIRITPMYSKYREMSIENERLKKKVDYLKDKIKD